MTTSPHRLALGKQRVLWPPQRSVQMLMKPRAGRGAEGMRQDARDLAGLGQLRWKSADCSPEGARAGMGDVFSPKQETVTIHLHFHAWEEEMATHSSVLA